MKLYIPDIGTKLVLKEDVDVTIFDEYRNTILDKFYNNRTAWKSTVITLPKGLMLSIDRIYVRKGLSQYSSVTFNIPKVKTKKEKLEFPYNTDDQFGGYKFWLKLLEVNTLEVEPALNNIETKNLFIEYYKDLEKHLMEKYDVGECTKALNYINNLLPSGQTVTNIDTKDNIDVFMNNFIKKLNEETTRVEKDIREEILAGSKKYIREYKMKLLEII